VNPEKDGLSPFPKELATILMATTVIFAFNVWQHSPAIVPNHYTDIVSIYYRNGIGNGPLGIPYVDYVFEYPTLVGAIVYVAALIARSTTSDLVTSLVLYKLIVDLFLYAFTLVTVISLYKLTVRYGIESKRIWQVFLVMPSFLMFVDYNFDIIAIAFALLAMYLFIRDRPSMSAVLLGLGVCAKLYPGILLPAFLAGLPSWRSRGRYVAIAVAVVAAANLPFMATNFHTWLGTWSFLAAWGIENSWLIFLFGQMDPLAHYVGFAVLLYIVYKVMQETHHWNVSSNEKLLTRSFLLSLGWLLGSYIVTPQMALILLPFYVLIPAVPLLAAYASDTLNALIMVFWFGEMGAGSNPLAPDNPVQWIALTRQLIWLGLLIQRLYPSKIGPWVKGLLSPLAGKPRE
jgi:uncharacterized membrane protein